MCLLSSLTLFARSLTRYARLVSSHLSFPVVACGYRLTHSVRLARPSRPIRLVMRLVVCLLFSSHLITVASRSSSRSISSCSCVSSLFVSVRPVSFYRSLIVHRRFVSTRLPLRYCLSSYSSHAAVIVPHPCSPPPVSHMKSHPAPASTIAIDEGNDGK